MGVATALAGNIFYQYTPNFECSMYNDSSTIKAHAFNNLTEEESKCEYYKTGCDEDEMSSMAYDEIQTCFENAEKTACTEFVYSDPVFNETLVKGKTDFQTATLSNFLYFERNYTSTKKLL